MNHYQLFKSLHHSHEGFFLGNVHDVLSAIILEKVGFKAIGTTSWGVANSMGYRDGQRIAFGDYLHVIKKIVDSVKIPVSIDIEAGFSDDPNKICENILMVADLGAAGINLEDSLKDSSGLLVPAEQQSKLLTKIRSYLDQKGYNDFFINARADTFLQPSLENRLGQTITRGKIYAQNGADGFFVPCLTDETEIAAVIQEVPLPLNLMSLPNLCDFRQLRKLGVKRFSFGNALSDFLIASLEAVTKKIYQSQDTGALYQHASIETIFK